MAGVYRTLKATSGFGLIGAAKSGDAGRVSAELAAGADANQVDADGRSPVYMAAREGHADSVAALVKGGASVNLARRGGTTPLGVAARFGHTDCVTELLMGGADADQHALDGSTPLHIAAGNGHVSAVKALLAGGASIDRRMHDGWSALHLAAASGKLLAVQALLAAGADPTAEDACGKQPADVVCVRSDAPSDVAVGIITALVQAASRPAVYAATAHTRPLGRGAFGTTHLVSISPAQATTLRLPPSTAAVVVKTSHASMDNPVMRHALREVDAMGKLERHPHIVRLLDHRVDDAGRLRIVMEWAQRGSLPEHVSALQHSGCWSVSAALRLAVGVAKGLEHAHGLGVWHRDLKPDNILVAGDGRAMLGDWGLARSCDAEPTLTRGLGTPLWMAPEVVSGVEYNAGADIWSLGVVLYQLLCARFPKEGDSPDEAAATSPFAYGGGASTLMTHIMTRPPDLSKLDHTIPSDARALIVDMLANKPTSRPSAAMAAARLTLIAESLSHPTAPDDAGSGPVLLGAAPGADATSAAPTASSSTASSSSTTSGEVATVWATMPGRGPRTYRGTDGSSHLGGFLPKIAPAAAELNAAVHGKPSPEDEFSTEGSA
jgi:serine/threonine protein kinase